MIAETVPYIGAALGVSGSAVWMSHRKVLIQRWLSWVLIAPLVCGFLWFGTTGAALFGALLGIVAAAEHGRLVHLRTIDRIPLCLSTAVLPFAPGLLPVAVFVVAVIPMFGGDVEAGAVRSGKGVFGLVWLAPLLGFVLLDTAQVFALCIAVAVADVAAWCGGKGIGGPFVSAISPAKRWSGILTGALAGTGVLVLLGAATPALVAAVVVGAPLGDLFESMVKRAVKVKDAGTWLPGFGGLLDRVDSLLGALALAVILG